MNDDGSLLYACAVNDQALIEQRLVNVKAAQLKKSAMETGTPLHAAALHGNLAAVDLLLAAGANLEAGNFMKNNAMLCCIEAGKLDMARHLIERGSDVNKKGCQNRHALSQLILFAWDRDFAQYLVSRGCHVNQTALDQQNLLGDAAGINNADAIEFLLANGVERTFCDGAVRHAVVHNGVAALRTLLAHGASLGDMYAGKGIEKSTYHWATREGAGEMIALLKRHGVDFGQAPARAVVVGIDSTKLSPLEHAKAKLAQWPDAGYLRDNIAAMQAVQ